MQKKAAGPSMQARALPRCALSVFFSFALALSLSLSRRLCIAALSVCKRRLRYALVKSQKRTGMFREKTGNERNQLAALCHRRERPLLRLRSFSWRRRSGGAQRRTRERGKGRGRRLIAYGTTESRRTNNKQCLPSSLLLLLSPSAALSPSLSLSRLKRTAARPGNRRPSPSPSSFRRGRERGAAGRAYLRAS